MKLETPRRGGEKRDGYFWIREGYGNKSVLLALARTVAFPRRASVALMTSMKEKLQRDIFTIEAHGATRSTTRATTSTSRDLIKATGVYLSAFLFVRRRHDPLGSRWSRKKKKKKYTLI